MHILKADFLIEVNKYYFTYYLHNDTTKSHISCRMQMSIQTKQIIIKYSILYSILGQGCGGPVCTMAPFKSPFIKKKPFIFSSKKTGQYMIKTHTK